MVYTLMFLVGALSLATTLLDIFLSETQKARLNELSIRTWSWVDEAKSTSIFQRFSSPRSRSIIQKFAYITSLLLYFAFVTTGEFGINGHHHTVKEYWHDPKLAVLFFISAIMMVINY